MSEPIGELCIEDYRNAPSGIGPQAAEWVNKPHRLIYDLCSAVQALKYDVLKWRDAFDKEVLLGKQLKDRITELEEKLSRYEAEEYDRQVGFN